MWRFLFLVIVMMGAVGFAQADVTGNVAPRKTTGGMGDRATEPRTGGDTIGSATVISGVPFNDTGATCGSGNDYDEVCPYAESTAPDVVYSYSPGTAQSIIVDLCSSQYDTKVYVWKDVQGNLIACNDDAGCGYSGWQSRVEDVSLEAGHTYYIVIDGYGTSCGTYNLQITEYLPCSVTCPWGAQQENESDCYDGYYDTTNGGCNTSGWTVLYPYGAEVAEMCGKSGTYVYQGLSYRDTDWYDTQGQGELVTATCTAEFPVQLLLIYGTDCDNPVYDQATADACQPATLSRVIAFGAHFWIWVGPSEFTGVPCGSDYTLYVSGICGNIPGGAGACCLPDGSCIGTTAVQCYDFDHGVWLGSCVSCSPNPCGPYMGACCHDDGTCIITVAPACQSPDTWIGAGTTCTPNPCQPTPTEGATWGRVKSRYR